MSNGNNIDANQMPPEVGRNADDNTRWSHLIHWHPHIDLSMIKGYNPFGHSKTASAPTGADDPTNAKTPSAKQANNDKTLRQEAHHHWQWAFPTIPSPVQYFTQGHPTQGPTTWSHLAHANVIAVQNAYIIEIEAPGLRTDDRDRCTVEWMSPRSLIIAVDVPESETGCPLVAATTREEVGQVEDKQNGEEYGGELSRVLSRDDICYLVKERHMGRWRRSFTLPEDAFTGPDAASGVGSTGGLKWEVEDGLLRVVVARRRMPSAS